MTTPIKNPCGSPWQRKWLALDVVVPQVQFLADTAESWASSLWGQKIGQRCLVLAGAPGCGKTHVAARLYSFARAVSYQVFEERRLARPLMCLYRSWPVVVDGFKEFQYGVVDDAGAADVLFLDDVGAENDTLRKDATDKLCQILNRREGKFTVITTNIHPKHWKARFDERVYDRMFRGTKIVDLFKAPSYALVK